ncbi:AI-2E family transporter, partial [Acinetobacter nosocomialis]
LPFAKTLTILTFMFGLIPILGNLISNTLTFIAALTISLGLAGVALLYLVLVHKLEYFINAKIIGHKINANAWEILLAMLIFESIFGLSGLIAAPIFYAYLKLELKDARLI